ncbi:MAG: hypothetical protein JNL70_24230 [Saprospiraceae bacterium]|nr:hypothetical protein [Saprospiraceae bacterium]
MKNHNLFLEELFNIESEEERYRRLKEYMLTLNFDELMDWTKNHFAQLNASLDKGITAEEREKLLTQFSRFDELQSIQSLKKKAA